MSDPPVVAAVVLAAGAGLRLRPLTLERPKVLCPVANRALLDHALDRVGAAIGDVSSTAVNLHHGREAIEAHLDGRPGVHRSIEEPIALGTAGAIAHLRPWLDGRAALVVNGDTWCPAPLDDFVAGWDGERVSVLITGDEPFGPRSRIVASIVPAPAAATLPDEPCGLYEQLWRELASRDELDVVHVQTAFIDCATPADYLAANAAARRHAVSTMDVDVASIIDDAADVAADAVVVRSTLGAGAMVSGSIVDSVIWPGATVAPHEHLDHAIRTPARTVLIR